MISYVALSCILAVATAAPSAGWGSGIGLGPAYGIAPAIATSAVVGSVQIPKYNFNYAVNDPSTGDNKAQSEVRDGGVVKGSYSLTEPDGTVRVVEYVADDVSGFNAVVKRVGPAVHPATPLIVKQAPLVAPIVTKEIISPLAVQSVGLGWNGLGLEGHGLNSLGLGLNGLGLGLNGLGGGVGYGYGWGH